MKIFIIALAISLIIALAISIYITREDVFKGKSKAHKAKIIIATIIISLTPTLLSLLYNMYADELTFYKINIQDIVYVDFVSDKSADNASPNDLADTISQLRYEVSKQYNKETDNTDIDIDSNIASKRALTPEPSKSIQYYRVIKYIDNTFNKKNKTSKAYLRLADYSLDYVNLMVNDKESNQKKLFTYSNTAISSYLQYLKFYNVNTAEAYSKIGKTYQLLANYLMKELEQFEGSEEQKISLQKYTSKLMILSYCFDMLASENLQDPGKDAEATKLRTQVTTDLSEIECDIGIVFDNNQVCLDWFKAALIDSVQVNGDIKKLCNLLASKISDYSEHAREIGLNTPEYYLNIKSGADLKLNNKPVETTTAAPATSDKAKDKSN